MKDDIFFGIGYAEGRNGGLPQGNSKSPIFKFKPPFLPSQFIATEKVSFQALARDLSGPFRCRKNALPNHAVKRLSNQSA
jgi:hypothetical protein